MKKYSITAAEFDQKAGIYFITGIIPNMYV